MKNIFKILFLIGGSILIHSQNTEDKPDFYKEMMSTSPNVHKVDELYEHYRKETPIRFAGNLEQIQEMKAKAKGKRSSWVSNARKELTPIKREFRDEYEKQYIDWRRAIQSYIQADGSVIYPTEEEFIKSFKTPYTNISPSSTIETMDISNRTKDIYSSETTPYHSTFNGWKYFGPIQLVTNNGQPTAVSQANVRAFAQSKSNPNVVVCAVESGTIYISHNKGRMWHLATIGYNIKGITALAISPNDEDVIYAAGSDRHYVSRDGGVTWEYITTNSGYNALPSNYNFSGGPPTYPGSASKILVVNVDGNPLNDIVLFATSRGILKLKQEKDNTTGNISYRFEQKLPMNTTDIIKRTNRDEFFALAYDLQKKHMYFYSSIDNGETWARKTQGWYEPNGAMQNSWGGRLAMSLNNENVVYAYLIENRIAGDNGFLGVYRSNDGGENWFLPNTFGPGRGNNGYNNKNPNIVTFPNDFNDSYHQGFYNCAIIVNPDNPDHFIIGGLNAYSSNDGGATFKTFGGYWGPKKIHVDMQTFYQQKNSDGSVDTWLTTDGGINYSTDFFESINIVRTAGLGSDYWGFDLGEYNTNMGGGMYHNGNNYYVETYGSGTFKELGGAESSTGYIFPGEDERHMYFSDFGGIIASKELNENQKPAPKPNPTPNEPHKGGDATVRDFRGNTYYYKQNGEDSKKGLVYLYRFSRAENQSILLKELQLAPKTGIQQYIVSFSQPMYQYIVAGNELYSSKDGGNNWTKVSKPFNNNIRIAISDNDPNIIYALRRYQKGNNMLKKSIDGGKTFTDIASPNSNINYGHIIKVRGTDVIFLFGNSESKVFYLIDGIWKEYSEDLPNNLNVLEPKIQYRAGEFYMATSGAGIWTRKLPNDVLAKMGAIKINIDSPIKFSFYKDFNFKVTNASLYYGKTITQKVWEFPGASKVLNSDTDNPTVIYDKFGRFPIKLTLTDSNGNTYSKTFPNYFTVYPNCACDIPNILKNLISNIEVWVDTSKANLTDNRISDKVNNTKYSIKYPNNGATIEELNGHKVLSFKNVDHAYIDLNKDYEGSTIFVVSKLDPLTSSSYSFLLGSGGAADFHSDGKLRPIFSRSWITNRNRFSSRGAKTMINNIQQNFFKTGFITDNLALYTLRVGEGQTPAKVRYISRDRGQSNRNWRGEIAEVIIFNKRLSDDEISQINQYLMNKYGLQ